MFLSLYFYLSQKKTPPATKSSLTGSKVHEESDTGPKMYSRKNKDVAEEKLAVTPKKSAAKEKSGTVILL